MELKAAKKDSMQLLLSGCFSKEAPWILKSAYIITEFDEDYNMKLFKMIITERQDIKPLHAIHRGIKCHPFSME